MGNEILHIDTHQPVLDPTLASVLRRIRLRAQRRVAWLRHLWEAEGQTGGGMVVTHAEIDTHLLYRDAPEAEYAWYAAQTDLEPLNRELAEIEAAIAADDNSRFTSLRRLFRLSAEESDLLQLCLALKLDPSLARVYAYLHDHAGRGYATEELALRLFGYGHNILWKTDGALARWGLVSEKEGAASEPVALKCDPFMVQWLLGHEGLDAALTAIATWQAVEKPLEDWPLHSLTTWFERVLNESANRIRFCLNGPPGSGRRTLAANIANHFQRRLLVIDTDAVEDWRPVFMRAQRQALLDDCWMAWQGDKALQEPWLGGILHCPVQFVIAEPGQKPKPAQGFIESGFDMPELPIASQETLLRQFIPVAAVWNPADLHQLAAQHRIAIGDIRALADRNVQTLAEAADVIRTSGRHRLGELAQLLECPFSWNDLIVPDFLRASLEDFAFEARERKQFWEQDKARALFPQGQGLVALFTGSSGTGKTMAAQVMAAELGLDLYRIDLSTVVSKYVGETSQNLARVLAQAAYMDIVLLFDEADALFGKRTEVRDAHDRFANTDTNYLLQAIENYRGIALLSTNKKENIDSAFTRRLRYVLEFPKPDARQRALIWSKVVGKLSTPQDMAALNGQLDTLAQQIELTGAQIKFAVLSALFAARRDGQPLQMKHFLRGLDRELLKEGRALSPRERTKLLEHA